jgi:RNA polymerase sigma-70 factor (ECF subfamily)
MHQEGPSQVTALLRQWRAGDHSALERLTPLVYVELHRRAHNYMKNERPGHTLQTTALANEAWMRLVDVSAVDWKDRAHFFAIAAQMMRRILLDRARARHRDKRGGGAVRVELEAIPDMSSMRDRELVAIDDALEALARLDPRKAKVVELRFFGGLEMQEIGEVLGISEVTARRDWSMARSYVLKEMGGGGTR